MSYYANWSRRKLCVAAIAILAFRFVVPATAAELLMFEEPGCPWCARWRAEVGPGYAKSTEGQRAPVRSVMLADAKHVDVKLERPVNASPTFVLVDNGREVGRIIGYPGADFFWGMLEQLFVKLDNKQKP